MTRAGGPLVGLVLAGFGFAAAIASLSIGTGWDAGSWGPRAVPLLAAGTMVLAGLADAFGARQAPVRSSDGEAGRWQVPLLVAIAIVYVLLVDRTGYLFATALAAPSVFALFGMRSPLWLALVAIGVPLALHLIFFRLLAVFPPLGSWFDLSNILPI